MTVKELRTLVDNLNEYIHIPGGIERLKKTILHLAVSGQLAPQDPSEGTGEELYQQIQAEKAKLIAEGKLKKQKTLPEITREERPFDIPDSWKWVRLNDAYDVRDGTHDTPKYVNEGIPLVTSKNLSSGRLDMTNVKYITGMDHLNIKLRSEVNENDILFAMIGSIGNPAIVDTEVEFSIKNVALFKPYSEKTYCPEWLLMSLTVAQDAMKEKSAGGVQSFVSLGFARSYPSPLPPISEQSRIVIKVNIIFRLINELTQKYQIEQQERRKLVVSSLTKLAKGESSLALDKLTEIIKTKADAAELRKTILHLAVSGQLVPQIDFEGTGQELLQKIQAEKAKLISNGKLKKQKTLPEITQPEIPFKVPKTWKWVRLGDAAIYQQRGKSPKYTEKSQYPVISQRCVRTNHIDWSVVKYINPESLQKYEGFRFLKAGDLLLNSTGTGTMGRVGIYQPIEVYEKVVADGHVTVVRVSDGSQSQFMHIYLNSPFIQSNIESKASGSTNQIEWNLLSIQQELVPIPPHAEQTRIVQKTTQLLDLVSKLEGHLE